MPGLLGQPSSLSSGPRAVAGQDGTIEWHGSQVPLGAVVLTLWESVGALALGSTKLESLPRLMDTEGRFVGWLAGCGPGAM